LIKDVGSRNVRCGAVLTGFGNVNSIAEAAKMDQKLLLHQYDSPSMWLQMGSFNEAIEPRMAGNLVVDWGNLLGGECYLA
jgi:hypothetical protein